MRRNALCLFVVLFVSTALSGCSHFMKNKPMVEASGVGPLDMYIPPASDSTTADSNYQAFEPTTGLETTSSRMAAAIFEPPDTLLRQSYEEPDARFHTVAARETLYSLARQYYGDHRRWKDIYSANRSSVRDPNKIFIGQRLAIP